jgi:hypothetical protein
MLGYQRFIDGLIQDFNRQKIDPHAGFQHIQVQCGADFSRNRAILQSWENVIWMWVSFVAPGFSLSPVAASMLMHHKCRCKWQAAARSQAIQPVLRFSVGLLTNPIFSGHSVHLIWLLSAHYLLTCL